MSNQTINGLILGGGKSSRMGIDKGLIVYHDKPQREHLVELLVPVCRKVFLSCKTTAGIPAHLNPLPDHYAIESPLNGILSAFRQEPGSAWLTVPVDMPEINNEVIEFLLTERDANCYATCFYDSEGKLPEPLLCVWEPSALPQLVAFHERGHISPRQFLATHRVKLVHPPFPGLHLNINSQAELEEYRKRNHS